MRRAIATGVAAALLAAAAPQIAGAQSGLAGWDGKNPFACTLQQLGGGTDFPEPDADPFCVEYDKRHQNVNNLGVVDFLSKEPARVPGAEVDRGIGGIRLDQSRRSVRRTLGAPTKETLLWVDYCMTGGGRLVAGFSQRGDAGQVVLVLTNSRPFDLRGIRTGDTTSSARQKLGGSYRMKGVKGHRPLARREKTQLLLVGTYRGRVTFVAVARPNLSDEAVKKLLNGMPH